MKSHKLALLLAAILIITTMTACGAKEPKRYKAEFLNLFDTYTEIVGYADDEKTFKDQVQFIHDELENYHQLYDIYNTYDGMNNLKIINDQAGAAPVVVDEKILKLLDFCKEIYDMTDGQVNVAFGSVLSIWHDYRQAAEDSPDTAKLPPMELLEEANKHTDIDDLIIDNEKSTVYLADPDMSLDVVQ